MAGLAIGSLVAGRVGDRVKRPLMWFGFCEVLIGVTAVATPAALAWLQRAYVDLHPSLPGSLAIVTLVRFAIAFTMLIVPTALMGATLPLVVKSSAFRASRVSERMALLYGVNTFGAIVGALVAGLWLIPGQGLQRTFLIAGAINLLVGTIAVVAGMRVMADDRADERPSDTPVASPHSELDSGRLRLVLLVFAVSGFTSLALEVVWFRVLTLFLRPTVYGYAFMLATILAGIALGSWLITPFLDRRTRWLGPLAVIELAIGATALLSFEGLPYMTSLEQTVRPWLSYVMNEWLVYQTVGSVLAIFPTALLMGIAFPIGLRLWTQGGGSASDRHLAERIGVFYSLNVTGSILGSIAAGFFMLPLLGSRASLVALASLSFATGLVLLAASEWARWSRATVAVAFTAVFAVALAGSTDPFEQFLEQRYRGHKLLWREEGVEATAAVHEANNGEISLSVNGNHQASTGRGMVRTHRNIGHLPMMLHPDPRAALVIGLGGGATAGAVGIHEGVDVDVVELAGAVARGAQYLDSVNYGVLTRPNVHLQIDDGRNHLLVTKRRYDIVTADVILPIYAGSGNLYSAEYFQLIRNVLKPGGLVLQWVAGTDAEYKTIVRTFLSVFPEATAWMDGTLLVGSVDRFQLRRQDFERKLQFPGASQGARDLGAETFEQLLKMYRAGPNQLRAFVGPGPILTDNQPIVEYFLSLPRDRDPDLGLIGTDDVHRRVVGN
jgi:spermidine synthase